MIQFVYGSGGKSYFRVIAILNLYFFTLGGYNSGGPKSKTASLHV